MTIEDFVGRQEDAEEKKPQSEPGVEELDQQEGKPPQAEPEVEVEAESEAAEPEEAEQEPAAESAPKPDAASPTEEQQALTDADLDEYDIQALRRGDVLNGVVIRADEAGVTVDVGYKREGFIPANDLNRLADETRSKIQPGAEIPVFVERPEDNEGRPVLSYSQAILQKDWLKAEKMLEEHEIFEGKVSGFNRGGVVVRFGRIRGFVPASHIVGLPRNLPEPERRKRLEAMIDQTIGLQIIEVDRRRRRLILSQRKARRVWQEQQREKVMAELTKGEVRHGVVSDITSFGAFVDVGGADGLVHISELSWERVDHPRRVVEPGDEVDVFVLDVDRERKRIALSMKRLQPDPWTMVEETHQIGQIVEGRVTRVVDFGAFIALESGIEGLMHVSEMIGTPELKPNEVVQAGETIPVKIIRIESDRHRIALSAKQIRREEWEDWMAEQAFQEKENASEEEIVQKEADETAPNETDEPTEQEQASAENPTEELTQEASAEASADAGESEAEPVDEGPPEAEEPQPAPDSE